MHPDYKLDDELTREQRAMSEPPHTNLTPSSQLIQHSLVDTLPVRFGVGPSTLEKPLGTVFRLPIGLVTYSSQLLRTYFGAANRDPDTGSFAAACDIYLLPDAKPEHFAVLADYILHGHGMLKSNLGKSILASAGSVDGERIHKVMDIDIDTSKASEHYLREERVYKILAGSLADAAVQRVMPQATRFLDAAEEVNTFISLCDKLKMSKAIWTAIASYDLIIRFAIMHNIPLSKSSNAMMPWGPLGDFLTIKNEEARKMMPKEVVDVCRGVIGAAYGRHMLMKEGINEETKLHLELNGSKWDSTVDQVEVAMKRGGRLGFHRGVLGDPGYH